MNKKTPLPIPTIELSDNCSVQPIYTRKHYQELREKAEAMNQAVRQSDRVRAELHWRFLEPMLEAQMSKEKAHYLYIQAWEHSRKHTLEDVSK